MLNEISEVHLHYIKLWYLVQHSLSSFQKLKQHFGSVEHAVHPTHLGRWSQVNIHKNHVERALNFQSSAEQEKFQHCLEKIKQCSDFILIDSDTRYPAQLLPYTDYPPILFGRGNPHNLSQPQVAIVGSRKPSAHGKQVAYDFAYYLSEKGFFITSGLALGIDEAAHHGALQHQRTIAVVGTGLNNVYPSQNQKLHDQILAQGGTVVSEFLPDTKPLQHHFPRRNRIVSGLSLGILVAEAKLNSGSLITAQAAANQGKTTFAIPGHIYSDQHQGCHQLIREGAILVDHPEQIIEDLALPTQWQQRQHEQAQSAAELSPPSATPLQMARHQHTLILPTQNENSEIENLELSDELLHVYQHLDWVGQDLDQLVLSTQLGTAELTGILMELELLGRCIQQSGLYLRCRLGN